MKKETDKQKIGRIGEDTAARFLVKKGFSVVERNYRKKWGEIDIIAKKDGIFRFVEVKTVSCENIRAISSASPSGRQETTDAYRPEDKVHPWKLKRLGRAVQTYLLDRNVEEAEWQCDLVTVFLDLKSREAKVELLENIMLL